MQHIILSFKPQRGKFTPLWQAKSEKTSSSFKPQRGKFTQRRYSEHSGFVIVSNPNGVNLHRFFLLLLPDPDRVSNPNGVNLHIREQIIKTATASFKPQRGKFTRGQARSCWRKAAGFKPQRGKFTRKDESNKNQRLVEFQTPTG